MVYKFAVLSFVVFSLGACQSHKDMIQANHTQSETETASCVRTILKLDEGRWSYMGTIARLNGTFRTYEAKSVHLSAGNDRWVGKSFGGDVGGSEETAEPQYQRLIGTLLVSEDDGELDMSSAVSFSSCVGPDVEGRYEAKLEYTLSGRDGKTQFVQNTSWYSEHGSYFAEDIRDETGRVIARRSGVNTPAPD